MWNQINFLQTIANNERKAEVQYLKKMREKFTLKSKETDLPKEEKNIINRFLEKIPSENDKSWDYVTLIEGFTLMRSDSDKVLQET